MDILATFSALQESAKGVVLPTERYSADFYVNRNEVTVSSAKEIIPIVLEKIDVKSVVDVGCDTGSWLSVFIEYGITEVLGIDGA